MAHPNNRTLTVAPGTDQLPLVDRLRAYIEVFESGCSVTQFPCGSGKPEDCPECVRAFVDAVKQAVALCTPQPTQPTRPTH